MCDVFTDSRSCQQNLKILVQRSLLEYSSTYKRYNYHRLIQEFFKIRSDQSEFKYLYKKFSEHFILILERMAQKDFMKAIKSFDAERHNIHHLFSLLRKLKDDKRGKEVAKKFMKIAETINHFMNSDYKFITELQDYLNMILLYFKENKDVMFKTFDQDKFVGLYSRLSIQLITAAAHMLEDNIMLIHTMEDYWWLFDRYNSSISPDVYLKYYSTLALLYEETGNYNRAVRCHQRLIKELKNCDQEEECSNFEIGNIYFQMKYYNYSMRFYEMELESMTEYNNIIKRAEILVKIYQIHAILQPHDDSKEKALLRIERDIMQILQFQHFDFLLTEHEEMIMDLIHILKSNNRWQLYNQLEAKLIEGMHHTSKKSLLKILASFQKECCHYKVLQKTAEELFHFNQSTEKLELLYYLIGFASYRLGEYEKSSSYLEKCVFNGKNVSHTKYVACAYLIMTGSLHRVPQCILTIIEYHLSWEAILDFPFKVPEQKVQQEISISKHEDFLETGLTLATSDIINYQPFSKRRDSSRWLKWLEGSLSYTPFYYFINILVILLRLFFYSLIILCLCLSIILLLLSYCCGFKNYYIIIYKHDN